MKPAPPVQLRIVWNATTDARARPARPREARTAGGDAGDVALVATLFAINLVPVVGELVAPGRWSPGLVGLAAAAALVAGRELWSEVRYRARP